ncbi:MAG: hypothetical protein KVP17_000386 [Porospora cf. gigantea B]|uniref:uncharacterized protein n=2 Tax=Porospora cf. gigantea B TaxID=2853592 RepID=UPI003571CEA0|nr:MAG: hypothetical protein KVP17_000386 [Porospora cf. gigantea B]
MSATNAAPTPSRMMLQTLQQKKKAAVQGHSLLKKKADALNARFRGMLMEIVRVKREMGDVMKEATYSLAKADWSTQTDFRSHIMENVRRPAVTLDVRNENVAGVSLPIYTVHVDPTVDVMGMVGVSAGGQVIQQARDQYLRALTLLIRLATLQTEFFTLDQEIRMTNRRVNALDNVVVPRLEKDVHYIVKELDEMEREEFFRLKKIQEKKREKAEEEEAQAAKAKVGHKPAKHAVSLEDDDLVF